MTEIKPTTFYSVYGNPLMDKSQEQALLYLYQPIIGAKALSLYLNLAADLPPTGKSESLMHIDLLTTIDDGLVNFFKSRERLEAIGLLQTFFQEDAELGANYAYVLQKSFTPAKFFQDPIMSYLLLAKVGERRYQRLLERFKPIVFEKNGWQNISKHFREVYQIENENFDANSPKLLETHQLFQPESPQPDFDWHLFQQLLQKNNVRLAAKEREVLDRLIVMYGLNELELAEAVAKAASGEENLNLNFLRQYIAKEKETAPAKNESTPSSQETEVQHFSQGEATIIAESKKIPPIQYLRAIKQQKGGFETNTETRLIEELISRQLLSKSVINILINYVLVIQGQAVLNTSYVNTIANDWAQHKIDTPEKAITYVRGNSQKLTKKTTRPTANRNYRGNKTARKENLPSHIKQPPKETEISAAKEAELNRKLAQFLNKEGDN